MSVPKSLRSSVSGAASGWSCHQGESTVGTDEFTYRRVGVECSTRASPVWVKEGHTSMCLSSD